MQLHEIIDHCAYVHRKLGAVWVVGRHPHDGAAIIVAFHNPETDEEEFHLSVSEDFELLLTGDMYKPTHGRAQEHYNKVRLTRGGVAAAVEAVKHITTPRCLECQDTGMRDSGGEHPWGEAIFIPCGCDAAKGD